MTTKTQPNGNAENYSKTSRDGREIQTILSEKAILGTIPLRYATIHDSKLRTVQWSRNPDLAAIEFSDGSIVYVNVAAMTGTTQEKPDVKVTVRDSEVKGISGGDVMSSVGSAKHDNETRDEEEDRISASLKDALDAQLGH